MAAASGTKGTTSTTPSRGWTPSWARRSSSATAAAATRPGGVLADQGEHGAVVVAVAVDVEQVGARGRGDGAEPILAPPLAHVHDALEHQAILPHAPHYPAPRVRWYGRRMGAQEWLIIAVVVLVLFGGSQLPKLARSLGEAQKEFKKGVTTAPPRTTSSTKSESRPERSARQDRRVVAPRRREPAAPERR